MLTAMGYGLLSIVIIVFAVSFVLSLILRFSSLTEDSVGMVVMAATVLAFFMGGFISGGKKGEKGWMVGGGTALLYILLVFLIQFLGYRMTFNAQQIMYHGGYLLSAILGGIIGVNLRSSR
ncbi:TIGR04086 family membrane protein [Pseudalkalibacillus caeni]|uniref:TIGR04086 family membrane protein n=2 Tax=Exobacillus caeni TaxID=2574798 RepID=A0A5R9F8P9_9BACL|nr:TIGR04086 family membrane protein [Pseudalkalibacillus caeni]